jgi:hypothetical protein
VSTPLQHKTVDTGFGVTHDITFDSGVTAGSLLILLLISDETVSAVATLGESNSISAADYSSTPSAGQLCRAWSWPNSSSSVTGFRITTSGGTQLELAALEYPGMATVAPFENGANMDADFTDTFTAPVSTTTTNGGVVASALGPGTLSTDNSNFTSAAMTSGRYVYNSGELGAAGSKTPGFVLTGSTFMSGFSVAYKTASAPSGNPWNYYRQQ